MTNFETALAMLPQHLPTVFRAQAFRRWLQNHDYVEMEAIGIELEPHSDFEALCQLLSNTTFHALEGRYHWDTNLLDYFRRRSSDIVWIESFTGGEKR